MSNSQNVDTGDLKGVRSGEASGWLGWESQTVRPRVECDPRAGHRPGSPTCLPAAPPLGLGMC